MPWRSPVWWLLVAASIAAPVAIAVGLQSGNVIDHAIVMFSLPFEYVALALPIVSTLLVLPWIGGGIAHRWTMLTRTREPLGLRLRRLAVVAVGVPAAVTFVAFVILGAYAFVLAPALGTAPADEAHAWGSYSTAMSASRYATFSGSSQMRV